VASAQPPGAAPPARPNVVVVLADDMGWGDLGCYGATKIPTPAMDRVAAEGVRATDCHSASAVCTPSRYALLTGRYAWRGPLKRRVLLGHSPAIIEADRPTLASVLRDAGYATGAFGKWHLGLGWRFRDGRAWSAFDPGAPLWPEVDDGSNVDYAAGFADGPTERGFDRFFGIAGSLNMAPYCYLDQDRPEETPSVPKRAVHYGQRAALEASSWDETEVDARFADEACSWIARQVRAGRPFFCYVATAAPHRPCLPPAFARSASAAGARGDMVCVVDWVVGRLDAHLQALGVRDETLFIVTSDNGAELTDVDGEDHGHRANGPWRGRKADSWEGGHRVPFLARWPGRIPAGRETDALFGLVDLLPTLARACDAPLPPGAAEDGTDVLGLWTGSGGTGRASLVSHSVNGTFALRREGWKLIMGTGSGGFSVPRGEPCSATQAAGQLYDLAADPRETMNRWYAHLEVVADLYGDLKGVAGSPSSGLSFDVVPAGASRGARGRGPGEP